MAFDIAIGQYHHAESVIHRLDVRAKLTLLFVLIVTVFLADGFIGLGVVALFVLIVIALSHVPVITILKALAPVSIFLLFPLLFNTFLAREGTELFRVGFILITEEGLYKAGFMTLRLLLLFLTAALLTLTTSPIALCDGMAKMLEPFERFGVPAFEISLMASIALRFIPTLLEDFDRIRKAQQARGAVFDSGGVLARLRTLVPCLVPLFAQSFRKAEELANAMESRCYHGGSNRTHYHEFRLAWRDAVAAGVCLVLLLVMVFFF